MYASWPPNRNNRVYPAVNPSLRGAFLPSYQQVDHFNRDPANADPEGRIREKIKQARIYSHLPPQFMNALLQRQSSSSAIRFPTIMQNKSLPVGDYLCTAAEFAEDNWQALGFASKKDYATWLKVPMLYAFSSTAHFCEASRVFDCKGKNAAGQDIFELVPRQENKTTRILSVSGFEFRGYADHIPKTYAAVQAHSKECMALILEAANDQNASNLVLIPFGMGVFLPRDPEQAAEIKQQIIAGWKTALSAYKGPKLSLHCCLPPQLFNSLLADLPADSPLQFVQHQGQDAYTIANRLEDQGERTLLINAADDNWKVLLKGGEDPAQQVHPGQFGRNHSLFDSTSDEYYSLMTDFALFSIRNMRIHHNLADCIKKLPNLAPAMQAPKIQLYTDPSYDWVPKSHKNRCIAATFAVLNLETGDGDTTQAREMAAIMANSLCSQRPQEKNRFKQTVTITPKTLLSNSGQMLTKHLGTKTKNWVNIDALDDPNDLENPVFPRLYALLSLYDFELENIYGSLSPNTQAKIDENMGELERLREQHIAKSERYFEVLPTVILPEWQNALNQIRSREEVQAIVYLLNGFNTGKPLALDKNLAPSMSQFLAFDKNTRSAIQNTLKHSQTPQQDFLQAVARQSAALGAKQDLPPDHKENEPKLKTNKSSLNPNSKAWDAGFFKEETKAQTQATSPKHKPWR